MRFPKPWYRPNRGVWYVTIDGTQHHLGPDRDEATRQYRQLMFPESESKTNAPRIVDLTEKSLEITERLVLTYPQGPIFRNTRGRPWTTDAVNCRFTMLKRKLGNRYCLYVFRHTWMNRLLTKGVDSLTVAILAGHADPLTLAKVLALESADTEYGAEYRHA